MSYIHQALRKAQEQRDAGHREYEGVLRPSRSKRSGTGKWTLIAGGLLGILAVVGYSWMDGVAFKSATHEPRRSRDPGPTSIREKAPDVKALYQVAKTHHAGGQLTEAKTFYEKALVADPGFVLALNNLGVILMAERDYPSARTHLEKAVRLEPDCVDACYNLACLFALIDEPEQGLKYLRRAISLSPKVRAWAKEDGDMERLRKEPAFRELMAE